MIGGLCKKSSLSEADMLFRKMKEDGIASNSGPYNTLIRAHLRGSDLTTSAELIEEMKSCGFSADASTVKLVMDMLSSGELDKSYLDMLSGPSRDKSSSQYYNHYQQNHHRYQDSDSSCSSFFRGWVHPS